MTGSVDFDTLFLQAENLRNNGQTLDAITAYQEIAALANSEDELAQKSQALYLAGVSAQGAISSASSAFFPQTLEFYQQAETLFHQLGDTESLGNLYRDIAIASDKASNFNRALLNFQKSIEILEKIQAYSALAITFDKLGMHYYQLGKYSEALEFISKAELYFSKDPSNGFWRATSFYDKAKILKKMGRDEEALVAAEGALGWFSSEHDQPYNQRLAQILGLLSVLYRLVGNEKKARQSREKMQDYLRELSPYVVEAIQSEIKQLSNEN